MDVLVACSRWSVYANHGGAIGGVGGVNALYYPSGHSIDITKDVDRVALVVEPFRGKDLGHVQYAQTPA